MLVYVRHKLEGEAAALLDTSRIGYFRGKSWATLIPEWVSQHTSYPGCCFLHASVLLATTALLLRHFGQTLAEQSLPWLSGWS